MDSAFIQSILLALLLGSVMGLERQWHRRLVDLKTNALVTLGACLFMLVTANGSGYDDYVRMAGQIVVGVGFVGGGLLFRDGAQTKGINTAATLWCCAAVGILCGIHRWSEASLAAFTIIVANTVLRQIAQFLNLKMGASDSLTESVEITLHCDPEAVSAIQSYAMAYFENHHLELKAATQQTVNAQQLQLSFTVLFEHGQYSHGGAALLQSFTPPGATQLGWTLQ